MSVLEAAVERAEETYTGSAFDLQSYLARSRQLDLSGIDFDSAKDYPLEPRELRALQYFMDIEAHTLCYLRDLLNAGAGADPEIADFLGCWLYEESYHGRAIERFVRACGSTRAAAVCGRHVPSALERLEDLGTRLTAKLFGARFLTVYMTWGAIQEHTTLNGYITFARKTKNPVLAELLRRIARDESRHFGFYYYKAYQGLKADAVTRALVGFLLKKFWTPVGEGVKPRSEADFLIAFLFEGPEGREALLRIDRTMARLPGMEWFDLMARRMNDAWARLQGVPA
jgi:hypothetical protein